jgi:hypothetical protein
VLSILSTTHAEIRTDVSQASSTLGYDLFSVRKISRICQRLSPGCQREWGEVGGNVPRRNGPMLTPGTSAYVAGIILPAYTDARYLMCCGIW